MPTSQGATPFGPGDFRRTPSESCAFGKLQFTKAFAEWSAQWTQPALMALAEAVLGEKALHSSQIHGFSIGALRDPAPKVLVAIGRLNCAIAAFNLEENADRKALPIPDDVRHLAQGKRSMQDDEGYPMNELGVFCAVAGLVDLEVF